MVMIRSPSNLERSVLQLLCPSATTAEFLSEFRLAALNDDQSILDIIAPNRTLGEDIVELGHGYFKSISGETVALVLVLGDELGNPRQIDFHGLSERISIAELENYQFVPLG
jgi:hypothetical protein